MIYEGYILNRHFETLFKEDAIGSLNDLEIKDLIFEKEENLQQNMQSRPGQLNASSLLPGLGGLIENDLEPSAVERKRLSLNEAWTQAPAERSMQ